MKIVLLEPTDKEIMSRTLELRGNTLEPYAIEALAAYALSIIPELDIEIMQQYDKTDAELTEFIAGKKPDVFGISPITCNIDRSYKIARGVKKSCPDLKVVIGGQHASIVPEEVAANPIVDAAVIGEGEITFVELLKHYMGEGVSLEGIAGLCYRADDGQIKKTRPRERIRNLDELPDAVRVPEILKRSNNWNLAFPAPDRQTGVAQINTTRGCPYSCSFCISPVLWASGETGPKGITFRSPERVVTEIRRIQQDHGVNFFYFNDLTFNQSPVHMRALCNEIISSGLHVPGHENDPDHIDNNIHWFCMAKIGLSQEDAQLLADAGCVKIGFGIESFDDKELGDFNKPFSKGPSVRETLAATNKVGIFNRVYIIMGSPHEKKDAFETLLQNLLSMDIDQIRVAFIAPYPNTASHTGWKDYIIKDLDYSKYTVDIPLLRCENFTSEELLEKRHRLIVDFYTSEIYHQRILSKIERFPHLRHSYEAFALELKEVSNSEINLKF